MYPVVFFDALRVKVRDEAVVRSKAVYLALAILPDGSRDILGIWVEQTEGATFWMKVFTDLKTRGCQDILIAVTDGLKGMSDALSAICPHTTLQTCIVHLIRHSLDFANWRERHPLSNALRPIYAAPDAEAARAAPGRTSFLRVSAGCPACDLHDECPRERPQPVLPTRHRSLAMNQFAILYEERFTLPRA
jgi:transposase-like protein